MQDKVAKFVLSPTRFNQQATSTIILGSTIFMSRASAEAAIDRIGLDTLIKLNSGARIYYRDDQGLIQPLDPNEGA